MGGGVIAVDEGDRRARMRCRGGELEGREKGWMGGAAVRGVDDDVGGDFGAELA